MKTTLWILLFSLLLSACGAKPAPAGSSPTLPAAQTQVPTTTNVPPATQAPTAGSVSSQPTPSITSALLETAIPSPQAAQPVKMLQDLGIPAETMEDTVGGFAFEYPSGWIVRGPSEEEKNNASIYTISLRSAEITPGPKQQEGLPEGLTAIDFSVSHKEGPKTLIQAVNERRAAAAQTGPGQPLQILIDEDWILPGGLPAHRFVYNLGPAVLGTPGPDRFASEVVTLIQGQMVLVSGQGDLSLVEAIAATLREGK